MAEILWEVVTMYLGEADFIKWTEHINSIVGTNSLDGAFWAAEKTDRIEIMMAGEKEEVLELLAAAVYNFSKNNGIAFEDAITEIEDAWDKLKQKEGYMQIGDEIVDMQTGIGINEKEGMISFPIPPKDIQDEIIASIEEMNSKTSAVKERLRSVKDIFAFFKDCTEVSGFIANEETGEKGIEFVYNGDRFMYILDNNSGMLSYSSESGSMGDVYFEDDEIFRKVVSKLLEESDMS